MTNDHPPKSQQSRLSRLAVRGFGWLLTGVLVGVIVFSSVAGVLFWYDWLSEQSPWELFGGLVLLLLMIWLYRYAIQSVDKR